jgi:hypothetical protein
LNFFWRTVAGRQMKKCSCSDNPWNQRKCSGNQSSHGIIRHEHSRVRQRWAVLSGADFRIDWPEHPFLRSPQQSGLSQVIRKAALHKCD